MTWWFIAYLINLGDNFSLSAIPEILSFVLYNVLFWRILSSSMLYKVLCGIDIFEPPFKLINLRGDILGLIINFCCMNILSKDMFLYWFIEMVDSYSIYDLMWSTEELVSFFSRTNWRIPLCLSYSYYLVSS